MPGRVIWVLVLVNSFRWLHILGKSSFVKAELPVCKMVVPLDLNSLLRSCLDSLSGLTFDDRWITSKAVPTLVGR